MRILFLMMIIVFLNARLAHADCTNPAGIEGEQVYNSTHKVMQYCDGTDWTAMRATGKADQGALDALTTTVGQKANQSALNSLSSTVSQKADQSALNSLTSTVNNKVNKSGDTMTGALTLNGAPIANNQAATKEYVDTIAASSGGGGANVFKIMFHNSLCPSGYTQICAASACQSTIFDGRVLNSSWSNVYMCNGGAGGQNCSYIGSGSQNNMADVRLCQKN